MGPNWTQPARKQVYSHGGCSDLHPRPSELQMSVSSQRWASLSVSSSVVCHPPRLCDSLSHVSHFWPVPFILSVPPPRCFLAEANPDYGLRLDQFHKSTMSADFHSDSELKRKFQLKKFVPVLGRRGLLSSPPMCWRSCRRSESGERSLKPGCM